LIEQEKQRRQSEKLAQQRAEAERIANIRAVETLAHADRIIDLVVDEMLNDDVAPESVVEVEEEERERRAREEEARRQREADEQRRREAEAAARYETFICLFFCLLCE
jgi:colicin import membrane protein